MNLKNIFSINVCVLKYLYSYQNYNYLQIGTTTGGKEIVKLAKLTGLGMVNVEKTKI